MSKEDQQKALAAPLYQLDIDVDNNAPVQKKLSRPLLVRGATCLYMGGVLLGVSAGFVAGFVVGERKSGVPSTTDHTNSPTMVPMNVSTMAPTSAPTSAPTEAPHHSNLTGTTVSLYNGVRHSVDSGGYPLFPSILQLVVTMACEELLRNISSLVQVTDALRKDVAADCSPLGYGSVWSGLNMTDAQCQVFQRELETGLVTEACKLGVSGQIPIDATVMRKAEDSGSVTARSTVALFQSSDVEVPKKLNCTTNGPTGLCVPVFE